MVKVRQTPILHNFTLIWSSTARRDKNDSGDEGMSIMRAYLIVKRW